LTFPAQRQIQTQRLCGINYLFSFLGRPTLVGKALSFTHELSFLVFIFYQSTVLSSRAVDGHQMYFGGSVVGRDSTTGIEISPNPSLIFTGGSKKCEIWCRFQHYSTLSRPRLKMQQDIQTLKQISYVGMIALCLCRVW